jgi:BirA family biotin operon repressor/biotin-[acetyl-CoA-carboxylase] ligase
MIVGSKIFRLNEVDSTNEYIKQILKDSPEGTVVVADTQTAGKGRLGKKWYSPEGGLWMSVLLQHCNNCLLPLTAGVSICETFQSYDILPRIKWPNDVLLNGKKIAGILTEIIDDRVILGMGINLNVQQFPAELREIATSVFIETKKHFSTQSLLQHLCRAVTENYQLLKEERIDDLLAKWRSCSIMLDRDVRIELPGKTVIGKVLDIDRQGALIVVRADYSIEHVMAGECRLLD